MTVIHISHGAGNRGAGGPVHWFVIEPEAGEMGHEAAVTSLLEAGRTVYQLEVTPWQDTLIRAEASE